MIREQFARGLFLVILGFCAYGLYGMFEPYLTPLFLAMMIAVVIHPLYVRFGQRFPHIGASIRSLVVTNAVLLFLILPVVMIVWQGVVESTAATPKIQEQVRKAMSWFQNHSAESIPGYARIRPYLPADFTMSSEDMQNRVSGILRSVVEIVALKGTAILKNAFGFFFGLFIFLFGLFFLLRDGPVMKDQFVSLLPFSTAEKKRLTQQLAHLMNLIVRGNILTSLAQALIATVGFLIVGAEAVTLLACLTFFASFIPAIGTAITWVPVALFFLLTGAIWKGVFLVVWGVVVIGLSDNFLRPLIVGGEEFPFFWLFFAILGGLQFFGLMGLVMGPLLIGMVPVLLSIYRDHFLGKNS